jgi:hypothetical protein
VTPNKHFVAVCIVPKGLCAQGWADKEPEARVPDCMLWWLAYIVCKGDDCSIQSLRTYI